MPLKYVLCGRDLFFSLGALMAYGVLCRRKIGKWPRLYHPSPHISGNVTAYLFMLGTLIKVVRRTFAPYPSPQRGESLPLLPALTFHSVEVACWAMVFFFLLWEIRKELKASAAQ